MFKLGKAATPATAVTVVAPERVPPAGFVAIATLTLPVKPVAVLPSASCAATCTAGTIGMPAGVLLGCTRNASLLAGPAMMVNAVLAGDVRAALRRLEHVVWLTAPAEELWRRVTGDAGSERPLARDEASFRALLSAREPLYREVCTRVEDTTHSDPGQVAARLAAWLLGESTAVTQDEAAGRGIT